MSGGRGTVQGWRLAAVAFAALVAAALLFDAVAAGSRVQSQVWALNQLRFNEFQEKLRARKLPTVDARFAAFGEIGFAPDVASDKPSGYYAEPFAVTLLVPDSRLAELRFTIDGSVPTAESSPYKGPILIDSTTVLRWRLLPEREFPAPPRSAFFIVGQRHDLPVIGLAIDPTNLWNKYAGIYTNPERRGRESERSVHVTWLPAQGPAFEFDAGIRIHGGTSRINEKKSFRLRFRDSAATQLDEDHPLRRSVSRGETQTVLRAGDVATMSRVRDALSTLLYADLGMPASSFEPFVLYINGIYWGIYDARERIWAGFLESRFGAGAYELLYHDSENIRRWLTPAIGDGASWDSTVAFFERASLLTPAALDSASRFVDLESLRDDWIHNIYIANVDWPYNNSYVYRRLDGDGRFRFMHWDGDAAFNATGRTLEHNTLEWALRERPRNDLKWNFGVGGRPDHEQFLVSTLMMRRLLENPEFQRGFIARIQVLLALHYSPARVRAAADLIVRPITTELAADWVRWGSSQRDASLSLNRISQFADARPDLVRAHLGTKFSLGRAQRVTIATSGSGTVRLEGFPLRDTIVTLPILAGTVLTWTATPDPGMRAQVAAGRSPLHVKDAEDNRIEVHFRRPK